MTKRPVESSSPKAQKACLNCRGRKIACDRSLPTCNTCERRKKVCPGYYDSLSWPKDGDKRRLATAHVRSEVVSGPVSFLNTSFCDTNLHYEYEYSGSHATHVGAWVTSPCRSIQSREFGTGMSPEQYSSAIRMITARGDLRQDVCTLLYRMSLTDDTENSLAVRHAMNAISFLHLHRSSESLHHYVRAVSALQNTLGQMPESRARSQAIAASMLLSLYESVDTHGNMTSWSTYFSGCLSLVKAGHEKHQTYEGDNVTLLDWVLYHNVMYKLTIAHWSQRTEKQVRLASRELIMSKAIFSPHRHIIQSTLGCSLELLELLAQAFDLVRSQQESKLSESPEPMDTSQSPKSTTSAANLSTASFSPLHHTPEQESEITRIERRVKIIDQKLCSGIDNEETHAPGSRKRYTMIARLFQLCAYIYLDRIARRNPMSSPTSQAAGSEAFSILQDLKNLGLHGCERPFVLFTLSLQAQSDEERLLLLQILKQGSSDRSLSNLELTKKMICAIWSQQDFGSCKDVDGLFVVNAVVSANKKPPQFT